MTKNQFIAAVASKCGISKKEAEVTVAAFLETVEEQLIAGEKVQLTGFGTFEVRSYNERKGRNPRSGEPMTIAPSRRPVFIAGKTIKDKIGIKDEA